MDSPDLLRVATRPVREALLAVLAGLVPPAALTAAGELVDVAAVIVLAYALVTVVRTLLRGPAEGGGPLRALVAGGLAGTLLVWIVRHPSAQLHEMFARGDHLAFAVCAGVALGVVPFALRMWLVLALSVVMLWRYSSVLPVTVALGAGLVGFAALRAPGGTRPWTAVATHAALGAGIYAVCWRMRSANLLQALHVYGLFSFVFLRQVSFAVAACGGARARLGDYLCFLVFYPGAVGPMGAPEVYGEFARRNLTERARPDHAWGMRKVVHGMAQVWAADRIPMTAETVFASPTTAVAWWNSLVLFVQVALRVMGYWALIDATAAFFGFRLRQNFAGILTCRNPSELWRSWRGTLTSWLVTHVYGPLGANRRHQSLNILAAFGVSLVWHWAGVPFLSGDFRIAYLGPITLWAVANALAVVAHVQMNAHRWRLLPAATPPPVRRGLHVFFTLCLGTLSVTLPYLQLGAQDRFVPFVRRLVGL